MYPLDEVLIHLAPNKIIKAVVESNQTRKEFIVNSILNKDSNTVGVYRLTMKNDSDKVVFNAVKGMLPKNKLGREISKHIRIYKDTNHGHEAQQPKEWSSNK